MSLGRRYLSLMTIRCVSIGISQRMGEDDFVLVIEDKADTDKQLKLTDKKIMHILRKAISL